MVEQQDEDLRLVLQSREGNRDAFAALVKKYQTPMFNVALRMMSDRDEAEEIVQEAFVRAYEALGSFDVRYRFFSWLYRILTNHAVDVLKRGKRRESLSPDLPANDLSPEELHEESEVAASVQNAVYQLPVDYRAVIVLRHFQELSYEEIGQILSIPEKRVKSRLFSARMLLRETLVRKGYGASGKI